MKDLKSGLFRFRSFYYRYRSSYTLFKLVNFFVKLLFVKELSYENHANHNILEEELNINERI